MLPRHVTTSLALSCLVTFFLALSTATAKEKDSVSESALATALDRIEPPMIVTP